MAYSVNPNSMNYQRRQFLITTSLSFGLAFASLAQIAFTTPNLDSQSVSLKATEPQNSVRIVVISDLNSQYGSTTYEPEVQLAIALIREWKPDLVLCGGDMIAGQKNTLSEHQIKAMWDAFDRHIAQPLREEKIPLGFTIGNHDGSGAVSQGKFIFERDRNLAHAYWNQVKNNPGVKFVDRGEFPFYYSFTQKDIFYLVWDASTHVITQEQLKWVEKSLSSKPSQTAKMRIVIGHLPLYPVAKNRDKSGEFLANGEQLRSLLEKYQVHTYVSGHQHAYFPGKKGKLELLHAGALGGGPRQLLNTNLPATKTLTVVDVDVNNQSTRYTTYDMKTLSVIDIETLPRVIVAPNVRILRRDLSESSAQN